MEECIYGVYDLKAQRLLHGIMQVMPSDGVATRWFIDLLSTPDTVMNTHPDDFSLIRVGTIDMDTLGIKSYSVGASDPVTTGTAVVREYARRNTPDQPALAQQETSSPSDVVADLSAVA